MAVMPGAAVAGTSKMRVPDMSSVATVSCMSPVPPVLGPSVGRECDSEKSCCHNCYNK
jgi:hypothetical protein